MTKARPASAGPTAEAALAQSRLSPARRVAFEILVLIEKGKGHCDELLHSPRTSELSESDRNLTTTLVMGVLRWQIALDARLRSLLDRPEQRLADEVALTLRIGAFQLLHLDRIPAHAALSESVELTRAAGHPHATGMVNAVLRKLIAFPKPGQKLFETPAAFAERLGHPAWLAERWTTQFGRDAAIQICEADQQEPTTGGLFLPEADLPQIDDGSRLVAELAALALPHIEDRPARVWDCCAAPGGKTLMLARRLPAVEILATDVSGKRLARTERRARKHPYAGKVQFRVEDACSLPQEDGLFDLILCDVPCSGTGTLARNPEIRLRLKPEELTRQAERQREILSAALARLAPGGRLVYSTCSLEPEENIAVLESAASRHRRVPLTNLVASLAGLQVLPETLVRDGALRTLPGVNPCDGFYAVVLERER
ncbi:MAG: transcription antitermination factor NusB [Janthinobacterium lividum]